MRTTQKAQTRALALSTWLALAAPGLAHAATLTFVERATTDAISVHAGKSADNLGDILTFANPVYDSADKTVLGSDQGYCVRVLLGRAFECHWTLILPKGEISVDGPFFDTADSVLSVTGGTGAYGGARGEMKLHARDKQGKEYGFTYVLK